MSWYTDWFLADEGEAEAVAGIAADEHSFDDWPHLAMRSIGDMELMSLRGALRGEASTADYAGDTLYQRHDDDEGGVAVCRVLPELVAELAALSLKQVKRVAGQWRQHESMADWEPGTVAAVLREMIEFARRAGREGKSVLQLSTW